MATGAGFTGTSGAGAAAAELNTDGPLLELNVSDVHVRDLGTTQLAGALRVRTYFVIAARPPG